MGSQAAADVRIEGTQGIMVGEPPQKVFIMTEPTSYTQALKRRQKPLTIDVSSSQVFKPWALPHTRNHGQSLLKINPSATKSAVDPLAPEEARRTLWKCKRCNYRDSSKDVLLLHVKSHYENSDGTERESNDLSCNDCPFVANDAESLAIHKVHHRPNLEAIFKCYLCPYYVTTKAELLEHANLHGAELSVVHQSSSSVETSDQTKSDLEKHETDIQTPLLLDTRSFTDPPMVWVAKPDGFFAKMLKCRHCPYISSRKAEVKDHELMHVNSGATPTSGNVISCPDCTFKCNQRNVMENHANMHLGVFGKVQCLVADDRLDEQQLDDIRKILGLSTIPEMGPEPDLRETKLVYSCNKCPARFLCEKELCIHLRYHSTTLNYSCNMCSYAAKQPAHLLAHQKAHSSEYQERTRHLSSLYGTSQKYPPPMTACIEVKNSDGDNTNDKRSFAWIVVEMTSPSQNNQQSQSEDQRTNQVFTCTKCPARYFKLDALEYHMTLHGSNNRFKCEECDYSSKTAQNLMKHHVVHRRHAEINEPLVIRLQSQETGPITTEEPASDKANFIYPPTVKHGRVREKKFKCLKCPSAFEKRDQFRIHLSLHGSKQKYKCDKCDYAVKYYANYVQHLKKHHGNAEAQAAKRQVQADNEDDVLSIAGEQEAILDPTKSRRKSTISSSSSFSGMNCVISGPSGEPISPVSNQDKQTMMLMQKKSSVLGFNETNEGTLRCTDCPFSTNDQSILDTHKRRHGIERLTPPCPHCNYVPKKEENLNEHIKLHFTRMYKPEGYLIIDRLSLRIQKVEDNENDSKSDKENQELLFVECDDGNFLPATDIHSQPVNDKKGKTVHERVIIDPNTGEATQRVKK
uniref:C2H2-type domain-containing protein n=1 Tax=Bracon brevicornis TaxID=1563983 RepID=A0A6V7L768_9HYME